MFLTFGQIQRGRANSLGFFSTKLLLFHYFALDTTWALVSVISVPFQRDQCSVGLLLPVQKMPPGRKLENCRTYLVLFAFIKNHCPVLLQLISDRNQLFIVLSVFPVVCYKKCFILQLLHYDWSKVDITVFNPYLDVSFFHFPILPEQTYF